MLTKISLEDIDGNLVHEVETALVENLYDPDDPHKPWNQTIIWNDRVFVATTLPDCDAPHEYVRIFTERPVTAVIDGDESALIECLNCLATGEEMAA